MTKLSLVFLAAVFAIVASGRDITQWGPLGPQKAPYFSKLYQGMAIEAPFRLRSKSGQFDLIVTLDGRLVTYDNTSKQIVKTYFETNKEGPYVLSMVKGCSLNYLTNFDIFKQIKGSGTCYATIRDNGQLVLINDQCEAQNNNEYYKDACSKNEATSKALSKPTTYTFGDEPSKPPAGKSPYEGGSSEFSDPEDDKAECQDLPFDPYLQMNPGKYVKCKGSKELEFVPEGKFPSCDPDDIEGWYKYDPESKKWDYVDNKGNNNPWVPNGDNNDKLPFDPTKGPKYWILNPETGKWEYVPEGSPMPFDTSKNPTWPQYEWNPETRQWDYSQGGKDNLPFNPSAGKLSGVYVFNPETQKWEWYDKLDNVPFDYKDPNTPWYVYNLKQKLWKPVFYNEFQDKYSEFGTYVAPGASKIYEGQFMVSPTYLVSPNGLWFVKLSETGRLAIFRDGGETEFAPIGGNFGEEYGPYILTLSTPCTLVIRSTTKNRDKDSNQHIGTYDETCFFGAIDQGFAVLANQTCAWIRFHGTHLKLIHKDCFLGESIKYRPENPREIPYRLYPGESLSSGQILLSENEQFELRLNNQGGLVSWERESDSLVYPQISEDLQSTGPYELYVNNDCTFVIKDSQDNVLKTFGTKSINLCYLYFKDNGELIMKDERCENKYSSGTVKGLAIERCYRGESIEKSTLPVKDSSDGLEYPNKLYEGSVVQAPFEMRTANGSAIFKFEEPGNAIVYSITGERLRDWINQGQSYYAGKGPYTLTFHEYCALKATTADGTVIGQFGGGISVDCFLYGRYSGTFVLLNQDCDLVLDAIETKVPVFNNCVAGEVWEKSLVPNYYNQRLKNQ